MSPRPTRHAYLRPYGCSRNDERGLVALQQNCNCIHALFAFVVQRPFGNLPALQITELATARLPGTTPVKAMMEFANRLALELALPQNLLDLEPSSVWALDDPDMVRKGYFLDRVTLRGVSTT